MSIFRRYTRRSLRRNPSRTIITVIGIMLSMALLTAVLEGAYSGVSYLIRVEAERAGAFEGYTCPSDEQQAQTFCAQSEIKTYTSYVCLGWARLPYPTQRKQYLCVQAMEENFTELVAVHLSRGRMPQNAGEILLPDRYMDYIGTDSCEVGQQLALQLGERRLNGADPGMNSSYDEAETLVELQDAVYTVVGFYEGLDSIIEAYSNAGLTALTLQQDKTAAADGTRTVFFTVKDPRGIFSFMQNQSWTAHRDILLMNGSLANSQVKQAMYAFVAVLLLLIAFGSISLIYNSFSISVGERTKQFGILKSIGATGKQIRASVLYEAVLLCVLAIPLGVLVGCTGIGITLWCLRDSFWYMTGSSVQMQFVLSPALLALAALLCLLTTLISAYLPARRALRIEAIEAIRRNRDIAIRGKEVRVSRLTWKLFGFSGLMAAKNFKRDRKRYRATVVSLFLSVTLFISASSFCAYLTDVVDQQADVGKWDVQFAVTKDAETDPTALLQKVLALASVEGGCFGTSRYDQLLFSSVCVTGEYLQVAYVEEEQIGKDGASLNGSVRFLDDASFRRLLQENGLSEDAFFRAGEPRGVVCNRFVWRDTDGVHVGKYLHPSSLPVTARMVGYADIEGYIRIEKVTEDGQDYWLYYSDEYLSELEGEDIDPSMALRKPADEVEIRFSLPLAAAIETCDYAEEGQLCLLYPYSAAEALFGATFWSDPSFRLLDYDLTATQHAQAEQEVRELLLSEGFSTTYLQDVAAEKEGLRSVVTAVQVFAYGFIVLITLIALANVVNTVSTNVALRRREFAMLRSVGITGGGLRRMTNFECLIYGYRGLLWGLPASVLLSYGIYSVTVYEKNVLSFYIPWYSIAFAVCSVFIVVFATMLYSMHKIKGENPIDALRNENA